MSTLPQAAKNVCFRLITPVSITHRKTKRSLHVATRQRSYPRGFVFSSASLPLVTRFKGTNGSGSDEIVQKTLEQVADLSTKTTTYEPSFLVSFWQTFSCSKPVEYMQDALVQIHDYSGLPWWATIALSTVVFRSFVTLPLAVYQHRIAARLEIIGKEMPAIVEELKREAVLARRKFNWTEEQTMRVYRRSLKKQWNALIVRDNCHPMKTVIVLWGQIPLWICQSVALRNLVNMLPDPSSITAQIAYAELMQGGFGWIPNLLETDQLYILPVALGIINLANVELQIFGRVGPSSRLKKITAHIFRGVSLVMVPIACTVPSALCVYWVASSSYGLAQNIFLLSPKMRRVLRIPKMTNEREQPFTDIRHELRRRANILSSIMKPTAILSLKSTKIEADNKHKRNDTTKS